MDINPITEDDIDISPETLSYDDTTPYSEQHFPRSDALATAFAADAPEERSTAHQDGSRLADRIGSTKVYLLPETAGARAGKVRR